jgi:predicted PolB exonuclease-like 3'-5' exonuclease
LTAIDHVQDFTEPELLKRFWANYDKLRKAGRNLVGFNSRDFDVPFIAQRSIMLGVPVPKTLIQNERYLDRTFIDLRDRWGFGGRSSGTLDLICKACGFGGKPDGITGAHFSKLFSNLETQQQAIDYLVNDLEETYRLAERILL